MPKPATVALSVSIGLVAWAAAFYCCATLLFVILGDPHGWGGMTAMVGGGLIAGPMAGVVAGRRTYRSLHRETPIPCGNDKQEKI